MISSIIPFGIICVTICSVALAGHHEQTSFLSATTSARKEFFASGKSISRSNHSYNLPGVKFYAKPDVIENGADVELFWEGMASAKSGDDVITVSCGPIQSNMDYLDLVNVSSQSPSGSILLNSNFVNMRCNYVFTYISMAGTMSGKPIASFTVKVKGGNNMPTQGHIAYSENHGEIWVSFVSGFEGEPAVKLGLTKGGEKNIVFKGTSTTYSASDMCQSPANRTMQLWFRDPGMIHHVLVKGLKPGTEYFYEYGHIDDGGSNSIFSAERSFVTRPSVDNLESSVKFIAYADMGYQEGMTTATNVMKDVFTSGYNDFLIHFGDISYARGQGWQWEKWFHVLEPLASQIPYMVSIGNHEYDHTEGGGNGHDPSGVKSDSGWHPSWGNLGDDSNGECGVPMYKRFKAPKLTPNKEMTNGIFWYSFNVGPVHIVMMSTEHDWTKGSKQYQFLETDLANVNRTSTPWVILTGHRMMYTTQMCEEADYEVSLNMQEEMEDLIYKYQVNLMLYGHQHNYERTCKVYKKTCTTDGTGTVHSVIGSAGASLEKCGFNSTLYGNYSTNHVNAWGYSRLQATHSSLQMDFILNEDQSVFDSVNILPWGVKELSP